MTSERAVLNDNCTKYQNGHSKPTLDKRRQVKLLTFSTGKKQNKLRLNMNNEVLQETASTKYLAVTMDNKLTRKD